MESHVQVPKQSAKTGRWHGTEWMPKTMLQTSWMIPSHVFHRIVSSFGFDKAAGCDLAAFKGKWARPMLDVDRETGKASIRTIVEHFTLWDLLASAFVAQQEGWWLFWKKGGIIERFCYHFLDYPGRMPASSQAVA